MKCLASFALLALALLPVRAELPPRVYKEMQEKAPVVVTILPMKVTTSLPESAAQMPAYKTVALPYAVTVEARVRTVRRGKEEDFKSGNITITFERTRRPEAFVGPAPVPIPKVGWAYTAYLSPDAATPSLYVPAAGGQSFVKSQIQVPTGPGANSPQ